MTFTRSIQVIDSHTAGEPTRVVVGGIPQIPGNTMIEKKEYLIEHLDHIRTALMLEPRGHNDMFGSVLTAAANPEADFGIIFMDGGGYLNMCGHGSIGAATVAVETGIVPMVEPETIVKMDAPAGLIEAHVKVENGRVTEVSFVNVPAFHYLKGVEMEFGEYGKLKFDISFGGSFFAIIEAKQIGIEIKPENAAKLNEFGIAFRDKINQTIKVEHPLLPAINTVDLVEIYDEPTHPDADYKNVVVFGQGQLDRSPCGTGTSAKMATLVSKGELDMDTKFTYESISGTLFFGRALEKTTVGEYDAIIPEITGSAYITAFSQMVIDDNDPLKHGFKL
ncbi:MAG: proline racemase [Tissierellia bacterium]|jgi:proline racemase|nr:proline racemase [Tissierellia bacterium]